MEASTPWHDPLLGQQGTATKQSIRGSARTVESKPAASMPVDSRMYAEVRGSRVNTGGGRLYRFFLCGRRDARKETASGTKMKKAGVFEGLDFDDFMNPVTEAHVRTLTSGYHKRTAAIRWVLNFLIGVCVALVAVLIIYCTRMLTQWRFEAVYDLVAKEKAGSVPSGLSFAVFWIIGLAYALTASIPVILVEPASGGAGIPEVKMILNGVKMPRITRFKTLVCRVFGNIFSVSSGLPAGYEGPMVSIGAAVSAGISQGKSTTMGFDTRWSVYNEFRNDKEKRDFIVCGASAGIAAAFNAPIGGVLFSYEESASFWHKALTWRAFFTAMVSAYVIDLILSGANDGSQWGKLSSPGMFNFGDFTLTGQTAHSWDIWELPLFILMGALGGLFGAMFVKLSKHLARFRISHVNSSKLRRLTDVVLVKTVVSVFAFWIPYILGKCAPIPPEGPNSLDANALVPFYCPDGEYNDIASFWFTPTEEAIRQLFHFTNGNPFSILHLGVFFLIYTLMMCIAAGTSVPAGLFIPTLLSGSALGRFVGETANMLLPAGMSVDAGTYSLIGSAAMLGGTTRMTISLAVILLECTGNYQYGLPIMMTLMAARFVGNLFNSGLYDMQIELRQWPMLEDRLHKAISSELRVCDVMTSDILVFKDIEQVGRVADALAGTEISGFPVIFSEEMLKTHPRLGNLAGYIQRKHLAVILANHAFHQGLPSQLFVHGEHVDSSATPYPMPPVLQPMASPVSQHMSLSTTHMADDSGLFSPGTMVSSRFGNLLQSPTIGIMGSLNGEAPDESISNERALLTATTGRAHSVVRPIRVPASIASSQQPQQPISSAAALRQRSKHSRHVSASTMKVLGVSVKTGGLPGNLPEDTTPEPVKSAALYNALYQGEYRYPDEPLLLWDAFEANYPRYPDVASIKLTPEQREMYIDLRPYMDPTPITVHVHCPINRAYKIFRELGLRHLMVTNNSHDIVGIISRSNLTTESLHSTYMDVRGPLLNKRNAVPVVLQSKSAKTVSTTHSDAASPASEAASMYTQHLLSEPHDDDSHVRFANKPHTSQATLLHNGFSSGNAHSIASNSAAPSASDNTSPATSSNIFSLFSSPNEIVPHPHGPAEGVEYVDSEDLLAFDDAVPAAEAEADQENAGFISVPPPAPAEDTYTELP